MCKTKTGKAFLPAAAGCFVMLLTALWAPRQVSAQTPEQQPTLAGLVGAENAAALIRGDTLSGFQNKDPRPALVPSNSFVRNMADEMIRSLKPSFFVENLSLYRKPPSQARSWTEPERTALYNESLALSSLAGLQYYSTSRKEMRTFYDTSAIVG